MLLHETDRAWQPAAPMTSSEEKVRTLLVHVNNICLLRFLTSFVWSDFALVSGLTNCWLLQMMTSRGTKEMQDNERTKSVARIRRTATFPEGGRVEVLVCHFHSRPRSWWKSTKYLSQCINDGREQKRLHVGAGQRGIPRYLQGIP